MEGFGKASFGSNSDAKSGEKETRTFWKSFYLKAGEKGANQGPKIVFRIMPPMKSLSGDGWGWRRKIGEHWGHVIPSKNPAKNRQLVFACIEQRDFNTKTVTQHCPKCDQIATAKDTYEDLKVTYAEEGKDEDEIRELTAPQYAWLDANKVNRQWNMNVMLADGTFGVLKLSGKTYNEKLRPLIDGLTKKEGIDPTDYQQGVWFEAYREGHKLKAVDIVDVIRETVDIPGHGKLSKIKMAPLSEVQLKEALKILPDLAVDTVFHLTEKQIQLLVDGSNDPEENLAVLSLGKKSEVTKETAKPASTAKAAPKAAPKAAAPVVDAGEPDDDEEFLRSLGE